MPRGTSRNANSISNPATIDAASKMTSAATPTSLRRAGLSCVAPLRKIQEPAPAGGPRRMVTLINADTPVVRPASLAPVDHLTLSMHDIVEELADMTPPGEAHVEALFEFARSWDRSAP